MPHLPSDLELHLVKSLDDAMAMKRWLGERRRSVLGFDTETSGLNPYAPDAKLRTIQIGDLHTGWIVPYEQWGGAAIECLDAWEGEYAAHNLPFDANWLSIHAGWNIPWHRAHDTEVMARIVQPSKPAALKRVSDEFVDPRASEGQKKLDKAFKDNGWGWHNVPIDLPEYWLYGALDPVLAAHLFDHFRADEQYNEVYQLEMAVLRICTEMSRKGMRVDLDYSRAKYQELTDKVESNKKWAQDNWGISITSGPQLADFLEENGAVFEKRTAKGAKSTAKDQFELFLLSENKFVADAVRFVQKTKNQEKMANGYFENFIKFSDDGLVHPNIRTLGARTSRMSVVDPALQTVPRGDSLVRDAFIPMNDSELLLSCDYSQVEMRLLAHFSSDEKLRGAFTEADKTGGDFFVTLGKEIYADPDFSKKDSRRGLVKGTMYGAAYGSGIQKMADTAGVPYEQMKSVTESVFKAFPGIRQFMQDIEKVGKKREKEEGEGYVLTQMGRRLPCDEGKVYALTNYILQGTAAELMKKSIVRLDACGFTDYMKMPIHDEMIFSVPKNEIEEASKEIEEIMSYTSGEFSVDLPAEPEAGMDRWGDKYRKEGEIFGYQHAQAI